MQEMVSPPPTIDIKEFLFVILEIFFAKEIVPFELYAHELPIIHDVYEGKVLVSFIIDEEGNVSKAEIVDSFNVALNEVVLDKVRQTKYKPAVQNGRAVRVKYQLPIVFK